MLACGVEAGTATTGLFSKNFTTSEAVDADVKFELLLDGYYDLEQTVGAFRSAGYDDDADYLAGLDGEAIMTFKATTDPEVSTYYYMMMPDVEGNWMSDTEFQTPRASSITSTERHLHRPGLAPAKPCP